MNNFTRLHDLLVHELEDLLSAERLLVEALPKMANAATDRKLKEGFEKHLKETREQHISRLNEALRQLGQTPNGVVCKGMQGIVQEGEEIIRATGDPATIDAALIGAAQRAEHYEMAAYGTARAHAEELGLDRVAELLQENLDSEGQTNKTLTKIAEGGLLTRGVNPDAAHSVR
jgi:ferritin-like metal-binding protein YciE